MRYMTGCPDLGITFHRNELPLDEDIILHADVSYGDGEETDHSVTGLLVMMGGGPVKWTSKIQKHVTISKNIFTPICTMKTMVIFCRKHAHHDAINDFT